MSPNARKAGVARQIEDNWCHGYPADAMDGPYGSYRDGNGITHLTGPSSRPNALFLGCSYATAPGPLQDKGPVTCMSCLILTL